MYTRFVFALVLSFIGTAITAAQTQEPTDDTTAQVSGASPAEVREVEPRVFVLRDSLGRRIYVPDFSFERWEELIKQERNLLPASPPAYSFTEIWKVSGQFEDSYVALDIDCSFELVGEPPSAPEPADGEAAWHRIPLRFLHGIRDPDFKHDGPGRLMLTYDTDADGHVAWVNAAPGTRHRLRWKIKLPLVQRGTQHVLNILAPLHPLGFEMTLPESALEVSVTNPDSHLLQTKEDGESTAVSIESVGGELQLSWRRRAVSPAVLEASGDVQVRIVDQQMEWTAALRVRSYGNTVEKILVRLPTGSQLIPSNEGEFVTSAVVGDATNREPEGLLEVRRRDGRAVTEFAFTLRAIQTSTEDANRQATFEAAGFEIVGAVRQSGSIEFNVMGDLNVDLTPGLYVRQVTDSTDVNEPETDVVRFVYHRQPFSLRVRITAQEARTTLEPIYIVDIGRQQIVLDARILQRSIGGRARELSFEFPGWTVQQVNPQRYVTGFRQEDATVIVELATGVDAAVSDFELQISATQSVDEAAGFVSFALPRSTASASAPSQVVVFSAENVQLAPRAGEIRGLLSAGAPPNIELPARRQPPLVYQEDTTVEGVAFSADLQIRERMVRSVVHSQVRFERDFVEVTQDLSYTIDYESIRTLPLSVPRIFEETGRWQVSMDGVVLPAMLSENAEPQPEDPPQSSSADEADSPTTSPSDPSTDRTPADDASTSDNGNSAAEEREAAGPSEEDSDSREDGPARSPDSTPTSSEDSGTDNSGIGNALVVPPPPNANDSTRLALHVDLLEERIGNVRLQLRYRMPLPESFDLGDVEVEFVQPENSNETAIDENTLQFEASEHWQVTLDDDRWTQMAAGDQPFVAAPLPLYRSTGRVENVQLDLASVTPQRQSTTTIEQVWVQSWLTNSVRRDRVAYRLLTNDPTIELVLPQGVEQVEVAVNAQRWRRFTRDERRLTIELDSPTAVRHYTLEIWYWRAARQVHLGRIAVALPQLSGASYADRIFWQIIVPRSEHLLWPPAELTPEYVWQWSQHHWGRRPNRDQAELEELLGASAQSDLPVATNVYLFSSVGPLLNVDVLTASRASLVLILSGALLFGGLLLVGLPKLWHPITFVVLGIAVLAVGLVFPEPTLLATQAATLGAVLVLVSRLLRWVITLRRQRRPAYSSVGRLTTSEPPSTPTATEGGPPRPATTITPPAYQVTAAESEP